MAGTGLLIFILAVLRDAHIITIWEWALGIVAGFAVGGVFAFRLNPSGFNTSSEKTSVIAESFETVCHTVPMVISSNHWKLRNADLQRGLFNARIGWSWHTVGSTLLVIVTSMSEKEVSVYAFCGTRSINDPGHNDKMIAKFFNGLDSRLKRHNMIA